MCSGKILPVAWEEGTWWLGHCDRHPALSKGEGRPEEDPRHQAFHVGPDSGELCVALPVQCKAGRRVFSLSAGAAGVTEPQSIEPGCTHGQCGQLTSLSLGSRLILLASMFWVRLWSQTAFCDQCPRSLEDGRGLKYRNGPGPASLGQGQHPGLRDI